MSAATLAILAGGEGRRMGRPKAELRVGGKPILEHLLDRFAWTGPTLLVTAPHRERPPGAERFDREVVDPVAGEGPLRGVMTALQAADREVVVVTTCDMPALQASHLAWLGGVLTRHGDAPLAMLRRAARVEPFPLAIRTSSRAKICGHFAGGARAVQSLATLQGAMVVDAPAEWGDDVWTNLNTPGELTTFNEEYGPQGG